MRQMIKDPKRSALFLEYAFGKPKAEIELSGEVSTIVKIIKGVSLDDV